MKSSRWLGVTAALVLVCSLAFGQSQPRNYIKIAGLQMIVTRDIDYNERRILEGIKEAAKSKVDFLVTPEGSLSGIIPLFEREVLDRALERVVAAAREARVGLALGTLFKEKKGDREFCYNQIRFYAPEGDFLGAHSKILLGTSAMRSQVQGQLRTFTWRGICFGALICNDLWATPGTTIPNPYLPWKLKQMGAQVIFHVIASGWDQQLRNFQESSVELWAKNLQIPVVEVNTACPWGDPVNASSGVVGPDGTRLLRSNDEGEQFFVYTITLVAPSTFAQEQSEIVPVTVENPQNGTIELTPTIPPGSQVPLGTVITVKATPAPGYAVDSVYFYNPGTRQLRRLYYESSLPEFEVTIDREKVIGASFIEQKALQGFTVKQDIVYAQPSLKKLKYDVYTPDGAKNLPCIVIMHGWDPTSEDNMRGLARELVRTGDYVVCSIDYRSIGRYVLNFGDQESSMMVNPIEDVYGAIAHIQEHAQTYGADPTRLAVTGNSAVSALSALAANLVSRIGTGGFGVKEGVYEYKPTYMPPGKTVSQVRREIASAIQVAAHSYGDFSSVLFKQFYVKRFLGDQSDAAVKAFSPIDNIPNVKDRNVPQLILCGTNDVLIRHEPVQTYVDALKAAGQTVKYVQIEGAGHAFFDWNPDAGVKATFIKYGIPCAAEMKSFFDAVFYPDKSAHRE